ncbi:MAG TPA: DUF2786 domain-containing protein [Kofleriaceae bacterium]|nr:DUF2786 domain-containing protein [Kofleriaceae bacterium]
MIPEPLSVELEAALLRALQTWYEVLNERLFGEKLRRPMLVLSESASRLGAWKRATRQIELLRSFVLDRPWPEVTSVLSHEMAHQYVEEVLQVRDETAHGETFRRVCEERGIDARAGGAPVVTDPTAANAGIDRVLERVRKLLALAASSNQHEAENAMRRAHELMLRHNIEEASAREQRAFEVRHVGEPRKRVTRVELDIVNVLTEFFFVEAIRIPTYVVSAGTRGHLFELCGTRANVEMAVHVYAFLLATAGRLWDENRRDARVTSGRDRLAYMSGVIRGFHDKLIGERKELRGTGLVWRGDAGLDDFFRARYPRITRRRRTERYGSAHQAGREAGRKIVLNRPIEHGPTAGAAPKRLRG